MCAHQNRVALRSCAHRTTPRPAHNSICSPPPVSPWPIPHLATCSLPECVSSSSTIAVSSDVELTCSSSDLDCGRTHSAACRCWQTPSLTAEPLRASVASVPLFSVLHSSLHFSTGVRPSTGALLKRLHMNCAFPSLFPTRKGRKGVDASRRGREPGQLKPDKRCFTRRSGWHRTVLASCPSRAWPSVAPVLF